MSVVSTTNNLPLLLVAYLEQVAKRPLMTKSVTNGTLSFLQEILASHLAGVPVPQPAKSAPLPMHILAQAKITPKAFKMALYGFFVSAPLSHYLVGALQRQFAGKTSMGAKIGQVLASNLIVAPIQTLAYLSSMAVIDGAMSYDEVVKRVKVSFMAVLKITWVTSPLAMVTAQRFIAPQLWVPFFNLVNFTLGTYFNTLLKRARLQQAAAGKGGPGAK